MNNKRWLSFFIVSSLLLLPVTSHYAMSWEKVKEKAKQYMSDDAINALPGAVILTGLAAVGLYYYWTSKKNDGDKQGDNEEIDIEMEDWMNQDDDEKIRDMIDKIQNIPAEESDNNNTVTIAGVLLTQFPVYLQTSENGGGPASCGYHTLLRGMQLVRGKSLNQPGLINGLMNVEIILECFNYDEPLGIWRKRIIRERRRTAIANILRKELRIAFKQQRTISDYDTNIASFYHKVIDRALTPQLVAIFERGDMRDYYKIEKDLRNIFIKSELEPKEKYINIVRNKETIDKYLNLQQLAERLADIKLPKIQDSNNGDWLRGEEIEFLWDEQERLRQQGKGIIPNDIDCSFFAIDDIGLIGKRSMEIKRDQRKNAIKDEQGNYVEEEVDADPVTPDVVDKLYKSIELQRNYFYIFGMGTMEQEGDEAIGQPQGHWFSVVLYQHADGDREYFVMDSMGLNRTNDFRVEKLIKQIEKKLIEYIEKKRAEEKSKSIGIQDIPVKQEIDIERT